MFALKGLLVKIPMESGDICAGKDYGMCENQTKRLT